MTFFHSPVTMLLLYVSKTLSQRINTYYLPNRVWQTHELNIRDKRCHIFKNK